MAGIKSLAKDTVIYGASNIIGRFLNWCLVPLYTIMFPAEEYGFVTYMYSIVALAQVILTYGMETGFFRFANHERFKNPQQVYTTALISLATTSIIFILGVFMFIKPIASAMDCSANPSFAWMMAMTVGIDAFTSLPFAYLRNNKRPIRFAFLKCVNIGLNIGLNLFFILLCPYLWEKAPQTISWFYNPDFGIGYIFLSNLISSAIIMLLLAPEIFGIKYSFNKSLLKEMLRYSAPLLVLGIAGIMNQTIDKILYPELVKGPQGMVELGIYGANYKIAIVMVMFLQAFRFAYEPFIFAQSKQRGDTQKQSYSDAMKYFVIFALFIFLGVMYYLDILKYFISPKYFEGLKIVPIIMMAEFFFGIFYNLSVWYKLTDKTSWGMWFSLLGLGVTLLLNVIFVPHFGYMACAWAAFACYGVMMLVSYFVGQAKYPINYNLRRLGIYFALSLSLYFIGVNVETPYQWLTLFIRSILLCIYVLVALKIEKINPLAIIRGRRK